MAAVNDPHVVLGSANVRFLKPTRAGEKLLFEARVDSDEGGKYSVAVVGRNAAGAEVFCGKFSCLVLGTMSSTSDLPCRTVRTTPGLLCSRGRNGGGIAATLQQSRSWFLARMFFSRVFSLSFSGDRE